MHKLTPRLKAHKALSREAA